MRVLALLVFLKPTFAGAGAEAGWASGFDHTPLDRVLKGYVNEIGEVDYAGLKKNSAELDRYVETLAATSPANRPHLFPTREDRLAYWLNAYNAFVLQAVAARYPVKSVRNMGFLYSFFWLRKFVAGGQRMTLRHLENRMIRKPFGEPRIHFVLVCASLTPEKLRALNALKNPKIKFSRYDWSINDLGSRARASAVQERELARGSPPRR